MGLTDSYVLINDCVLNHSFHVVSDDFPIPADGIIGLDFIRGFRCKVDFFNWKLTIRRNNFHEKLVIPIYDQPSANTCYYQNTFAIPARCEVVRRVTVTTVDNEKFIPSQEIRPGVFIGRTIVDKRISYVRILNTNDESVIVTDPDIKVEDLSDYDVLDPRIYECSNRDLVMQKLQKNFPDFAYDKLTSLCRRYLDIFALATDKISVNNFYKQKLRLKDDVP